MDTDVLPLDNLEFEILPDAELFYKNRKVPKNVQAEMRFFETNSIDMSKLDNMIFPKSKDFYALEKTKQ